MAWPVYSTRFLAGTVNSTAAATALRYVVPVGRVAIVRGIDCYADATGNVAFGMVSPVRALIMETLNVPYLESRHWVGMQVFTAGESFGAYWGAGAFTFLVSGHLLSA